MSYSWKYWDDSGEHDWPVGDALPSGADLFRIEFLNQFASEFNRRMILVNHPEWMISVSAEGDSVCKTPSSSFLYILCEGISHLMSGLFCKDVTVEDAIASDLTALSIEQMAVLFSTNWQSTGPRATRIHPSDGDFVSWEYSSMVSTSRRGDIIGPWILEDIRLVIEQAAIAKVPFDSAHSGNFPLRTKSMTHEGTSFADAYSNAVADWPADYTLSTQWSCQILVSCIEVTEFFASLNIRETKFYKTLNDDLWDYFDQISWTIAMYITDTSAGLSFDAMGLSIAKDVWNVISSGTITASDGTLFEKYPLDSLLPNPPPNRGEGQNGFEAVNLGLGFDSGFLLLEVP